MAPTTGVDRSTAGETETAAYTADGPSKQLLAARTETSLREEAVASNGHARTCRGVTKQFEDYIMSQYAAAQTWHEGKGVRAGSHRFTPQYADEQYGKIHGGLRWLAENTPPSTPFTTVLFTRTGWPYDDDGRPAPPVDFLDGLRAGRKKFTRTLRRTLDDHPDVATWGRVSVREPHVERRAGYPHAHDGVVIVGDVARSDLCPALDGYVDTNPHARETDHGPAALTVETATGAADGRAVELAGSLADELTNNLVGYQFDGSTPLTDVDDAVMRFASLMWATGAQSVTFGTTFREFVAASQADWDPDSDSDDDAAGVDAPDVDHGDGPTYTEPTPVDVAYTFPDEEDDRDS